MSPQSCSRVIEDSPSIQPHWIRQVATNGQVWNYTQEVIKMSGPSVFSMHVWKGNQASMEAQNQEAKVQQTQEDNTCWAVRFSGHVKVSNTWIGSSNGRMDHWETVLVCNSLCGSLFEARICAFAKDPISKGNPRRQGTIRTQVCCFWYPGGPLPCRQWHLCLPSLERGMHRGTSEFLICRSQRSLSNWSS